jgi:TPP-dependent pyruvate/acetoin dehydrogenase alpha subunit
MNFDRKDFNNEELIRLYRSILLPRMIEEKMLLLLRQGRVTKWFSGIGQEAIAVGATLAMETPASSQPGGFHEPGNASFQIIPSMAGQPGRL